MEEVTRFIKDPKQSFFLLGPRGTGKSTWLKKKFPYALYIDLLKPENEFIYGVHPEKIQQLILGHPEKKVVIIDEIQKIPELLNSVHFLIEEKKGIQFILTGSSARKLKMAGTNLLAGRALLMHMSPFIASEIKAYFTLEKALEIGMLPLIWNSQNPKTTLKSYVALYLKEEVQYEGIVRNIHSFARFLEVMSLSHANTYNTSNIARECGISRPTVDSYITILEDLLLGYTVPIFTKRIQRSLAVQPKFYYFDSGVFSSLRPKGPLDRAEEIHGAALEGLVCQHLKAWIDTQVETYSLCFWRTRSQIEVDFIVYGDNGFWSIEVKHSSKLQNSDFNGLLAFQEDYPEAKPVMLYRGKERYMYKNILCIPCEEFLLSITPDQPLF